jgi:hypothetical protein
MTSGRPPRMVSTMSLADIEPPRLTVVATTKPQAPTVGDTEQPGST